MKPTSEADIRQALRDEFGWRVTADTKLSLAEARPPEDPLACEVCGCAGTVLIVTIPAVATYLICPDRLSCRARVAASKLAVETRRRETRRAVLDAVHIPETDVAAQPAEEETPK